MVSPSPLIFILLLTVFSHPSDIDTIKGRLVLPNTLSKSEKINEFANTIISPFLVGSKTSPSIPLDSVFPDSNGVFQFYGIDVNYKLGEKNAILVNNAPNSKIKVDFLTKHKYKFFVVSPNFQWNVGAFNISHKFSINDKSQEPIPVIWIGSKTNPSRLIVPADRPSIAGPPPSKSFIESIKEQPMIFTGGFALLSAVLLPRMMKNVKSAQRDLQRQQRESSSAENKKNN